MSKKILIVEDDTAFGTMLKSWFGRNGYEAVLSVRIEDARKKFTDGCFDLVLTDLRLPDGDGIMLLAWIGEQKNPVPVIVMTGYGGVESAVSAIRLGAFDYIEKPVQPDRLKEKIDQALSAQIPPAPPVTEIKPQLKNNITGISPAAEEMYLRIRKVAGTHMSVVLMGESGTGKEYAARCIHDLSSRSNKPFIAVDCGSLSRELAPSELFGHVKGSFTSAISDKTGVFELANGGTVFLDEIGNLPYEVQVQLLRCLQERKVRPVGSARDIAVDVRIVAATNENLPEAVTMGKFREDLYHRISEFTIYVPPLRERTGDLEIFARHFLEEANRELGKDISGFSPETLAILERYTWSGNLRELRNVVRSAALFAETSLILPLDLPVLSGTTPGPPETTLRLRPANEHEQIIAALQRVGGNKTQAAKLLGIDRKTLYNKLHQYEIDL